MTVELAPPESEAAEPLPVALPTLIVEPEPVVVRAPVTVPRSLIAAPAPLADTPALTEPPELTLIVPPVVAVEERPPVLPVTLIRP